MILDKILDDENLQEAWKRVRTSNASAGIDRIRCVDFEKDIAYNLHKIREQIRQETYRPNPIMVFKDRKHKKGGRLIGISTVRDKVVQQAILSAVRPYFESIFLPCSYAYRHKKSALQAVTKAGSLIQAGHLWSLQTDVKEFFDSLDHDLLLDMLGRVIEEKPVIRLISKLLKSKIFMEMGLFDNLRGTQQGSGLSPLLSNVYLHPLDRIMWERFKDGYLRYSDDIAVFAQTREKLETAKAMIEACLADLKLVLHPEKSAFTHLSEGIVYLGFHMSATGKGPAKKSVDQLHLKLSEYDKIRKTDDFSEKLQEAVRTIRGWYEYYRTLDPIVPPNAICAIAICRLAMEFGQNQLAARVLRRKDDYAVNHPEMAFQLGELYFGFGIRNSAMREYARALKLKPDFEKAKEKIRIIQEGENELHRSIEKIQLVLHHNPNFREGYKSLAENYAKLGLYGFAETARQKMLELDDEAGHPEPENIRVDDLASGSAMTFDPRTVDCDRFLELFRGRNDAHAKQWVDERGRWGFSRVDRSLKKRDVYKHINGQETLAVFPVTAADTVHFIVFDVDTAKRRILETNTMDLDRFRQRAHQDILRIKTICDQMEVSLYIEDSGYKGRHGWVFFKDELPASKAVGLGQHIMKQAGNPSEDMVWELFPMGKSSRHESQIKLPLGINRKSNRRCLFLKEDGHPIPDQGLFLSAMKQNDSKNLSLYVQPPGESVGQRLPEGLKRMIAGCKVVAHLISKARDTNYLNHYERMCLLYTVTFAGEDGSKLLHDTIAHCINYDPGYTQKQIERRKSSPMSCAKIMENFPDLAQSLGCTCKFDLPPRGYPSPAMYLVEAELSLGEMIFQKTNSFKTGQPEGEADLIPENLSPDPEVKDVISDRHGVPALDFETLFSTETIEGLDGPADAPGAWNGFNKAPAKPQDLEATENGVVTKTRLSPPPRPRTDITPTISNATTFTHS